jgi:hypothetical protein
MPKRLLLALGLAALAIAACHNGSVSPSPSFTPLSPSPNPSITKATIEVTLAGTPAPKIPVQISTPLNRNTASARPGTPFETVNTGRKGLARFNHLKPDGTYCWVAIISPSFRSSTCDSWAIWQTSTIILGN